MTVRLTPRAQPHCRLVFGGVNDIYSTGFELRLGNKDPSCDLPIWQNCFPLRDIAEIELDDAPGMLW